jgi:maleate cis-trans isomerase
MSSTARFAHKLGVLVPFTNTNLEPDMQLLCPQDIGVYTARMGGYDADAIPDEEQMAGLGASNLDDCLELLCGVNPDIVIYGCTSATLTHGVEFDQNLASQIKQLSGAECVTAAGALVNALTCLNSKTFAFASPYVPAINQQAIDFLADAGFQCVSQAEVEATLDNEGQGALTPEQVFNLGLQADHADAQALVLSCTDMRSVETIKALEQAINKPVITSNQAMILQCLQLLGVKRRLDFGRLFDCL